ncbi:DNA-J related domain-containing protein [Photobacterium halotolerans]|uniref:DnaJ domain-containing protein n=1 Tax=Photobacterium halotolerans TaxID=265726 RepID=A0A7X5B1Z2_9GAMM|nr:DNA-J related domain-containing protein [Photobacterium halotolerans]NAW65691.1 DnaJ domain-containing protein [Photobacterium halotolerans]NAW87486.1 DnaJ domain-containing protein [Photobacterium halotolerans]NAX46206.1 DnaJ domain-containing protein [Photobacterium halotolerans]
MTLPERPSDEQPENPLIWPILGLLEKQPDGWMVHTLAESLKQQGLLNTLDEVAEQDLFKRNFLLMNALYQLQHMLLPRQWLQAQAMNIKLMQNQGDQQIDEQDPLREYYLDWQNYHSDTNTIRDLLSAFWQRYQQHIGNLSVTTNTSWQQDLAVLELPADASPAQIRKQWRRLALRWHPDRPEGNTDKFRQACEAWQRIQSRLHN